jgi:flagellar hook protein FlgE
MYTASTALDAFGITMAVVGNNIANVNTTGFKASRVDFADLLPTISNELETGHGVAIPASGTVFAQGALEPTSKITDLAISGNGFFILRDPAGGTYYSRAGQYHLNDGFALVNADGLRLQGTNGDISLALAQTQAAQPTSSINMSLNLSAGASTPSTPFPGTLDASEDAWMSASNFSAIGTIYDSLGQRHDLTFAFRKTGQNVWEYRVLASRNDLDATAPNSSDLRQLGPGGTLRFNSDGTLNPGLCTFGDIPGLTWVNSSATQTISSAGVGMLGSTQFAAASSQTGFVQDGRAAGSLARIAIDSAGAIRAIYTNGNSQFVDTVQLATFANPEGLDPYGQSLLIPTTTSGAAQIGSPGSGGRGEIVAGALEMSTVDLATEFVTMLMSQRAFQVNSQVITTADEMYKIAAQLKA